MYQPSSKISEPIIDEQSPPRWDVRRLYSHLRYTFAPAATVSSITQRPLCQHAHDFAQAVGSRWACYARSSKWRQHSGSSYNRIPAHQGYTSTRETRAASSTIISQRGEWSIERVATSAQITSRLKVRRSVYMSRCRDIMRHSWEGRSNRRMALLEPCRCV